ncbi:MAG: DUF4212 domain-containing protein [Cardiobacteriaceae bacterium]|nr:DUF4212 domain-containing protein [Cardiobacteriaceae bacterium]
MSGENIVRETPSQTPNTAGEAYWKANVRLIIGCLVVWAICSHGFAIWLRPLLSGIKIGSSDLGFWFGQQGAILCFIGIIFFYAWRMNQLDKRFGVSED